MAENDALPTAEQLQDLLLESPGFTEFLLELAAISASLLGGDAPMLCAITVERETGPATVASSSAEARSLDERQYAFDDGPCLTALRHQRTVLIADLQTDEAWAWYAQAVSDEGIQTILAVPIPSDNGSRSALNCYSTKPHAFGRETVAAVQEHAASLSRILRLAMRVHAAEPYPQHLRSALRSRAIVDSAVSLIMVHNRCGHEAAVELLQLASRSSNRRMNDIAQDILHNASDIPVVVGGGDQ
ncbi:GAF and ANTAR domain-containing protein [Pseudarthrobacter sulfonivorans]|uniref:GAF and ANTAR domain-containing protein n=1 Tax=Pseudarthrobacter sulfonivorans TaxID=121292 RepID=UPI00286432EF|nr:GAF and ANTAR domain-containing protein [Pseudarthrobacter sulfonivorans]MDR6414624.1 GAF domain-containing protein [Pseudarthrobacter sulfonivorans]